LRRRIRKQTQNPTASRAMKPPITPPAIEPLDDELPEEDEAGEVLIAPAVGDAVVVYAMESRQLASLLDPTIPSGLQPPEALPD